MSCCCCRTPQQQLQTLQMAKYSCLGVFVQRTGKANFVKRQRPAARPRRQAPSANLSLMRVNLCSKVRGLHCWHTIHCVHHSQCKVLFQGQRHDRFPSKPATLATSWKCLYMHLRLGNLSKLTSNTPVFASSSITSTTVSALLRQSAQVWRDASILEPVSSCCCRTLWKISTSRSGARDCQQLSWPSPADTLGLSIAPLY